MRLEQEIKTYTIAVWMESTTYLGFVLSSWMRFAERHGWEVAGNGGRRFVRLFQSALAFSLLTDSMGGTINISPPCSFYFFS
jgi:hypothetical protein